MPRIPRSLPAARESKTSITHERIRRRRLSFIFDGHFRSISPSLSFHLSLLPAADLRTIVTFNCSSFDLLPLCPPTKDWQSFCMCIRLYMTPPHLLAKPTQQSTGCVPVTFWRSLAAVRSFLFVCVLDHQVARWPAHSPTSLAVELKFRAFSAVPPQTRQLSCEKRTHTSKRKYTHQESVADRTGVVPGYLAPPSQASHEKRAAHQGHPRQAA